MTIILAKRQLSGVLFSVLLLIFAALSGCGKRHIIPHDIEGISDAEWQASVTAPAEYLEALQKSSLIFLDRENGAGIPVRVFGEDGSKAPVVFTHGLQSHSAWFAQSAALLAGFGHPVYVFDRSGSGLSRAPRGDIKDYRSWAEEIRQVAAYALDKHGYDRHLLVGHCFGAIPATVYAYMYSDDVEALVLTTPAIYTRTSIPFSDITRIIFSKSGQRDFLVPVMLEPELFSELDEYEAFIASDSLALTAATGDFYYQVNKARKFITQRGELLTVPLLLVLAGEDRIGDNRKNQEYFDGLPLEDKTLVIYEDARHILEFSPEKERFFADLVQWLEKRENRDTI